MQTWRVIELPEQEDEARSGTDSPRVLPAVKLAVHPATCGRLVVIYPGLDATLDCESRSLTQHHPHRYLRLAQALQDRGIAAVLRLENPRSGYLDGGEVAVERLRRAIEYVLHHAQSLCGASSPQLNFWGFSAGAGAAAALAGHYQPQNMVLVAPAWNAGHFRVLAGLTKFTGDLFILVGEKDEMVGKEAGSLFAEYARTAWRKKVIVVPGCDHFFTGKDHDALLEEATLMALSGEKRRPPWV